MEKALFIEGFFFSGHMTFKTSNQNDSGHQVNQKSIHY